MATGQTVAEIAISRFFQDGGHPLSWIYDTLLDHPQRVFGGLYHCSEFGRNKCNSFDNTHV